MEAVVRARQEVAPGTVERTAALRITDSRAIDEHAAIADRDVQVDVPECPLGQNTDVVLTKQDPITAPESGGAAWVYNRLGFHLPFVGAVSLAVVTTASYEARPFGVRSAIPMARALRLCPHLVVIRPFLHGNEALLGRHHLTHGGVQPGEHLRHANSLGSPQDAPTPVMAGQRGDQINTASSPAAVVPPAVADG